MAGEHDWVAAATVRLNDKEANWAQMRGSIRLAEKVKIDCLEIYCCACKRPWDDVFDLPCEALENNEHLRGGPIGVRRRRNHTNHNCELLGCDTPAKAPADGTDESDAARRADEAARRLSERNRRGREQTA